MRLKWGLSLSTTMQVTGWPLPRAWQSRKKGWRVSTPGWFRSLGESFSTDRRGRGRPCWCERWEWGPASACPPSSNVVWEIQPTSWPQSAGARGRADKQGLKAELRPRGCRLIIFPTHLIDRTHGAAGNGLHWASSDAGKRREMTDLGSFGSPSPRAVAWGWRGQWGRLLSPSPVFCLLLAFCFFSLQGQHGSGRKHLAKLLGKPLAHKLPCFLGLGEGGQRAGWE